MTASVLLNVDVLNTSMQSRGGTNRIPGDHNESCNLAAIETNCKDCCHYWFQWFFFCFFFIFTSDTGVDERRSGAGDHGPEHQR